MRGSLWDACQEGREAVASMVQCGAWVGGTLPVIGRAGGCCQWGRHGFLWNSHLASRCHAVHVEAINTAAAALYLGSGFAVESEETEAYARALNRNRRLLLHTTL